MDVYCLPGTMCDHRLWASTQRAIGTSIKLIHCAIPMENTLDAMVEALANRLPKVELNDTIVELFRLRFSANTITKLNKHQSHESNPNPS